MDEPSGSIVDEVAELTLAQYNAANTYSVTGSAGYDPGITMNPVAGGFFKSGSASALEPGTDDFNIKFVMAVNATLGSFSDVFMTVIREAGGQGFFIRVNNPSPVSGQLRFGAWAAGDILGEGVWETASVIAALQPGGGVHTWEIQFESDFGFAELFLDDVSQGFIEVTTYASSIGSSGVGMACDYRAGIDRNVPITLYFFRTKKSLT